MSTTNNHFIPFHHLSPSPPKYAEQCRAYKRNAERCTTNLKKDDCPEIEHLLGCLQNSHETTIDAELNEISENMWTELAALTICGHQKNSRTAAVQQWKSELQLQRTAAASQESSPRNDNAPLFDDKESSELESTPYQITTDKGIEKTLSCILGPQNPEMNRSSRESTTARNRTEMHGQSYIYISECEEAEGVYKLGHSGGCHPRIKDQEKCFPNLTIEWMHWCPDPDVFERVVQLELTQHRYNHKCPRCNRSHREWFKTSLDSFVQRLTVWCLFSKGLQSSEKRSQVNVPSPGFSRDPDRWYKWAQELVQEWDIEVSHSEPNPLSKSVVDSVVLAGESFNYLTLNDDAESVPDLSPPSSSALGSSDDDNIDPPIPAPIERSQNGKPILGQRLIIPATSAASSPVASPDVYSTPVESMPPSKGHVLYPRIFPGAYPISPVKGRDE